MKECPTCNSTYTDESFNYCLVDGSQLIPPKDNSEASIATEVFTIVRRPFESLAGEGSDHKTKPQSRKETLLRKSLDLVRSEADNGDAIVKIIRKALPEQLYDLAVEAMHAMSKGSDSSDPACDAVEVMFAPKHWNHISEDFADYCARRVLQSAASSGAFIYFGDHPPEARSSALGYLGLYFLSRGNEVRSRELWSAARDRHLVDTAISETCDFIVEEDESRVDSALALADLIETKNIKAKIMSDLTAYL